MRYVGTECGALLEEHEVESALPRLRGDTGDEKWHRYPNGFVCCAVEPVADVPGERETIERWEHLYGERLA